jgi:hypothetical protein
VLERAQQLGRRPLLLGPRERETLDALGVRILSRGEAARGQAQLAKQVVERLLGDASVALVAGHDPRVQVRRREQRVVVEHLLEVRHEPLGIDRVAVEAAADEVVHAARRHPVERRDHHRERLLVAAPQ